MPRYQSSFSYDKPKTEKPALLLLGAIGLAMVVGACGATGIGAHAYQDAPPFLGEMGEGPGLNSRPPLRARRP